MPWLRDGHRGELPAHARARASFGPETCAQAANLAAGHYIPVYRATLLLCQLAGVTVSTGWMAGIRGKAAGLVEASGFTYRVRELLKTAPAVHADETPALGGGRDPVRPPGLHPLPDLQRTGDRSADAIDACGVLPATTASSSATVTPGRAPHRALHAWCGVDLLRDLKGLYDFEPRQQEWALGWPSCSIEARDAASAAGAGRAVRPGRRVSGRPGHPLPGTAAAGLAVTSTAATAPRRTPAVSPAGSSLRGPDPAVRDAP